ncbi:ABC transporter ATP-binding protein [Streptomyces roseifaciens]|uniref:dipeptide ABC transporter ATP-binding protein n=1 Tax=Streptomyces roseifaciens TaxID=1488406 RepID=UPI0007182191|nr:ABC transporter ATP-binding protein [Streptomyces roseifaciens]
MNPASPPHLVVDGLEVVFGKGAERVHAVRGVSFDIGPGECLALIGESGSGKSATARTLVGLTGARARVSARRLAFRDLDLLGLDESRWRTVRGRRISLVLQDAMAALDPLRRVGAEVAEAVRTHDDVRRPAARARVLSLLEDVGVPEPARRARQYPHELSGGLRQRALIASAVAGRPELLVADEPTTALDATVAAQVLDLLGTLRASGMAILLISHDLTVVTRAADRVAVMHGGRIVERGPTGQVLRHPRHPYTRALLAAAPTGESRGTRLSAAAPAGHTPEPAGCSFAAGCPAADARCARELPGTAEAGPGHEFVCWHPLPRVTAPPVRTVTAAPPTGRVLVEADRLTKRFRSSDGDLHDAVREVSFQLRAGEVLGVVGESGSGKTTTARMVLGLEEPDGGSVRFDGQPWSGIPERRRRQQRRRIQQIHQDALGSFDPRLTVERLIGQAVPLKGAARRARVVQLLDQVGLPAGVLGRRPRELSGGQRQRVDIARALAPAPEVIVCDEPVSALDVTVQGQILDLLTSLQHDLGVAMLFISHDLGVIHHISDRMLVMRGGRVVEAGAATEVFARPRDPYTKELLSATGRRSGDPPSAPGARTVPPTSPRVESA